MSNPKSSNIEPWLNLSFDSEQGTLWNGEYGQKYGLPSASEQGNANANSFLDPNGLVSGFYNDVMGYTSQSREFAQQEYLMDKENAYNDPRAQMARMIAAGISPAAAAAAITGGQNVSAQAPSVASATPSAAAADAASSMVGGFAGAAADYASAATSNTTRAATLGNILADTENKVAASGLSKEQARAYGISNMFLSDKEQLNLQTLQKNLELMDGQRELYNAQIGHYDYLNRNLEQQIELFKSQGNLADMQALVEQKRGLLVDQQTFALQWQKNIRDLYHIDPSMPIENNSFLMWLQGDDNYKASLGVVNDINYNRYRGQYAATWFKMPSTAVEALENAREATLVGYSIIRRVISGIRDASVALNKVMADNKAKSEFDEAYYDAKTDLYDVYKNARRKYRSYKYSGASDQYIGQLKMQMDNAKKAYDEFDELKFMGSLVSSFK